MRYCHKPVKLNSVDNNRMVHLLLMGALFTLLAVGAGCGGGSEPAPTEAPSHVSTVNTHPTPTKPSGSSPTRLLNAVTGIAVDQEGDRASVTVEVGEAVPMAEATDETVRACDSNVAQQRSTPRRSIALPFSVSMTVLSSLPTDVLVNLNSFGLVEEGGSIDSSGEQALSGVPLWAGAYSDGATCNAWPDIGNGAGTVHWDAEIAKPHVEQQWNAWLIVPNAITPNDPTGSQTAQVIVDQPLVTLAGVASFKIHLSQSRGLVKCFSEYSLIPGNVVVLAENPSAAINTGCRETNATSSAAPSGQASTDAICNARYPSGNMRTVKVRGGSETIYSRQASLSRVCEGFGAPEDLRLTPGMSCALIAAAATYGGPAVSAGTNKLCDTTAIVDGYNSGGWVGVSSSLGEDKACGYFSDVFAGGAALVAAGAASESGPGAAAVGVGTYKALASFLKVACGGLLDGGASSLGKKLEADHETHVALDVTRNGKCLLLSQNGGLSGTSWHATTCPPQTV